MAKRTISLGCLLALAALAAGCGPATGDSTTARPPIALPGDATLSRVPLGAPPGSPLELSTNIPNPYEGDAVAVEDGAPAIAQGEAAGDHRGMQPSVGARELVGQIARFRAAFRQIAMLPHQRPHLKDRPGAGEAGLGIAIA